MLPIRSVRPVRRHVPGPAPGPRAWTQRGRERVRFAPPATSAEDESAPRERDMTTRQKNRGPQSVVLPAVGLRMGGVTRNQPWSTPSRRWLNSHPVGRALGRMVSSLGAGILLYTSFPPLSLWFLAPAGLAILVLSIRGISVRGAFGLGYLAGLGFFVPLLPWVGVYVGAVPWLALAALQAVAVAVFAGATALVARLPGAALWIACCWVATEAVRARLPFGGFPWGRLAFGQTDGPLLAIAQIAGAPGVSLSVALGGSATAAVVVGLARRSAWRSVSLLGSVLVTASALGSMPVPTAAITTPSKTVALVQGNVPRLGLDFNAQRRAVLDNHVARTDALAAEVAAGVKPAPDLVIWPENASDIDPFRNADAAERIDAATETIGAPILVGAVVSTGSGTTRNTALVWEQGTGPGDAHDKRRLVPFGEYLPMRSIVSKLSPYAAQAGNFVPGNGDGVVTIDETPLAVATCYEVAFDNLVSESVRSGAQLIAVPTNNATFGDTDMTYQQLAMSRLRAVEHNRTVVVAATSGVSAIIAANGDVLEQTEMFTADALVAQVPLNTEFTLATRLRSIPELIITVTAVFAMLVGWIASRRRRG